MREYLKSLRLKAGITQKEMSQKLDISESYYCLIENGERQQKMSVDILLRLSEIFDVPLSDLVEKEKDRNCIT